MTDLIDTVQLQEVGDSLIELFDITLPSGTKIYLCNGLSDGTSNIYFPQKTISSGTYPLHEYVALPLEISGLETSGSGVNNRPTLTLANIPVLSRTIANNSDGTSDEETLLSILSDEGLVNNEDLLTTRVEYRRTLLSYTYTSSDSAPSSSPVEFPSHTYVIDRVASETALLVQFDLASPIDVEGLELPNRQVIGRYCPWRYQGGQLENDGGCSWPKDSNGRFFNERDELITRNISSIATYSASSSYNTGAKVKTITAGHTQIWEALKAVPSNKTPASGSAFWKRIDLCSKTITGCKIRFQGNNTNSDLNTAFSLPFGGFPGTKKFK